MIESPVKRLTFEEEHAARKASSYCVHCSEEYADYERDDTEVYPDGCTAHRRCYYSPKGRDTAHWHAMTERCENCGKREPVEDCAGWMCAECASEYRALYKLPLPRSTDPEGKES